ncbi:YfhO family protein [Candidatus Gottesmanbacteria bacterium]|nr:YfhO family protein [Candidatus Gottesmanbacteria bacterium]
MGTAKKVLNTLQKSFFINGIFPFIVILVVWFLFSFPFFLRGAVPFPSTYLVTFFPPWSAAYGMPVKNNAMPDLITQIYPWKKFTIDEWKQGRLPLWNPYSFSGTPHAGNYQTAVFSIVNMLYLIFPFLTAWSLQILLQPLFAGFGMYLFLHSLRRSPTGALISSISFMFCGFMTVWMAYGTLGYAILFLPYALLGVETLIQYRRWWGGLLITVSLALSFFSGHFQISLYVFGFVFYYLLVRGWHLKRFTEMFYALFFSFLSLLVVMPQLFITYKSFIESVRSVSFGSGEIIPWKYLTTLFAPDFYGNPVTRNDWFGHYAEWSSYIGIVPLVLAVSAFFIKKRESLLYFGIPAAAALLLATPSPLSWALYWFKVPVLSTSAASRIIVLFSFSLSVLASFGWDEWRESWQSKKAFISIKQTLSVIILSFGLFLLSIFLLYGTGDKLQIALRNSIFSFVLLGISFFFILCGRFTKYAYQRILISLFVLILVILDMVKFSSKWMPFDPPDLVYPQMKVLQYLSQLNGIDRVFGNFGNEISSIYHVPSIEGYDAMYKKRYGEFLQASSNGFLSSPGRSVAAMDKNGIFSEKVLSLLGVRYILQRKSDGRNVWAYPFWNWPKQYIRVYEDEHYESYENRNAYPRAFLVSKYIVEKDDDASIRKLYSEEFDARSTVLLETTPEFEPMEGNSEVHIKKYTAGYIALSTQSDVPKILVLSDTYDSGWKVYVDSQETKLHQADYALRGVSIPPGSHAIEFKYFPSEFILGLYVSAGLLFLCTGMFLYRRGKT